MLLTNSAEGTNGAAVATTDSGAGNAFDTVNIGTGHTIAYDNVQEMHGTTSIKHAASGTSTGGYTAWTTTSIGSAVGTLYIRFYLYWSTLPSVDVRISTMLGAAAVRGAIRMTTTNNVRVTDSGGGVAVTTTTALSANTWYRVEVKLVGSATVGQAEIKLFTGDSTTPLETQTSAATLNTGGTIDAIRFGNTVPALNQTYWLDDLGVADTAYLGPSVTGPPPPITYVGVNTPAAVGTTNTASTTAVTPTLPTGTASGDRVFVFQSGNNTAGTTPTNWIALYKDVQVGPTGTAPGAGTGRRYISCYYRDYDGVWTIPAFSLTSATQNTNSACAITVRKDSAATWDTPTASSPGNTSAATTAYSVTIPSFSTVTDGFLFTHTATNDNVTSSGQTLTQTGATFANVTERADAGSATGNDVSIKVGTADVTVGATATLARAGTLSGASEGGTAVVQQTVTAGITYQGEVALTVSPSLSVDGIPTKIGAASLSAVPTLAVPANLNLPGAVNVGATASLTVGGFLVNFAAVTLPVTTALISTPAPIVGSISLPSSPTLTANGTVSKPGTATLTTTQSLTVASTLTAFAATTLSSATTLSVDGIRTTSGAIGLVATVSLSTTGGLGAFGTVSLSAISGLSTNGVRITSGAVTLTVTPSLSILAFLTAGAAVNLVTAVTLSASSSPPGAGASLIVTSALAVSSFLSAAGVVSLPTVVTLSVQSFLTAKALVSLVASPGLSTNGTLITIGFGSTPFGSVPFGSNSGSDPVLSVTPNLTIGAAQVEFASVSLSSSGSLSISGVLTSFASASMTATASLSTFAVRSTFTSISLVQSPNLSVSAVTTMFGGVQFGVVTTLATDGLRSTSGAASLTAVGLLSGSAGLLVINAAILTASTTLTTNGLRSTSGSVTASAVGILVVNVSLTARAVASLSVLSSLFAAAGGVTGTVSLVIGKTLTVNGILEKPGSLGFITVGTLAVNGLVGAFGAAQLNALPSLVLAGRLGVFASAGLVALGELNIGLGILSKLASVTLLGSSGLTVNGALGVAGAVLLVAQALLNFIELFPAVHFGDGGKWNFSGIHGSGSRTGNGRWTTAGIHAESARAW